MNTFIKQLGLAGALAGTLALGGGCSATNQLLGRNQQTWTMQADSKVPAAQGKIQMATDEKGNRDLQVEVKHMAPPDTVFSGTSIYVVWLKPATGRPQNIGVLAPDTNLNAKLSTTTPFTSFEVMVTAESTPQPSRPSTNEVMTAQVQLAS